MSLQKYVRQVNPRNESYIPPVDIVQSFFVESSLSKSELQKPAGKGPNSGIPRIEIFANKIMKGEETLYLI
jgi:hypothetical protein